jgi:hypothetical protein
MKYKCRICGKVFESKVGKGNDHLHMARHGYNLWGAKKLGLVEGVEEA